MITDQCIANVIVPLIEAIKGGGLFDLPDISSGKECQERSDILVFLDAWGFFEGVPISTSMTRMTIK